MAKRKVRTDIDRTGFKPGDIAAGYFRDSGGDGQDRSLEEQQAEWRKGCNERGLIIGRVFSDSRTGKNTRGRAEFNLMVEYFLGGQAATDGVRGLFLWAFSRFAREMDDFQFYVSAIRRAGYIVASLTDQIPDGDFGRFYEILVAWKDEQYSKDLSKNVRRGHRLVLNNYRDDGELYHIDASGKKVQLIPGGYPPIGYARTQVVTGQNRRGTPRLNSYWQKTTDDSLARRVRRAWDMMLEANYSYSQIEDECKLGLVANSYSFFFRTVTYTGVYSFGDFTRDNAFEAYVTREEFEKVQQIMDERMKVARKPSLHKYLLSGMLTCGLCGSPVYGSRSVRAGRSVIYYYECSGRAKFTDCSAGRIRLESLEATVLQGVIDALDADKVNELAQKLAVYGDADREGIDRQVRELRAGIAAQDAQIKQLLLTAIELGIQDEARALVAEAKEKKADLSARLKTLTDGQGFDFANFQLNVELLESSRELLCALLAADYSTDDPRLPVAHRLLDALKVRAVIYPGKQVSVTLDLGALSRVNGGLPEGD